MKLIQYKDIDEAEMITIEERVIKTVAEYFTIKESDVDVTSHLSNDLGADSLDVIEVTMDIEDEFGADIEEVNIVQDIIDQVYKQKMNK